MKRLNIRLSDEAAASLEARAESGGQSQTAILEGLLLSESGGQVLEPGLLQKVYERQNSIEIKLEELLEHARSVPTSHDWQRSSAPDAEPAQLGAPVCRHCGTAIALRPGQPATSTCWRCIAAGHWPRPGDCRKCAELAHLAGMAAQDSTGTDRSDIEYDPSA